MHGYLEAWRKYAVFSGRASRSEYWSFVLINVLISAALVAVDSAVGSRLPDVLYGLAMIVPSLAVGCRRLHDTDRTGWWQLLAIIPVLGWIALIVLQSLDGTHGTNKHGRDPRRTAFHGAAHPA
jgi:uncharacterized membrane protein YhaH (DUF805 family)